jgi:hypothetical protein
MIGPKPHWLEFWSHLVVPNSTYVEVRRDWSDLLEKYADLEASPNRAVSILQNTRKVMDLLDSKGVSCYLRELVRRYSNVCQWKVEAPKLADARSPQRAGQEWMSIEDFLLAKLSH